MALSFRNRQVDTLGATASDVTGYWGKVTASLDWCEDNYVISSYIAEFWNTLSNAGFIIPSLLAAYYAWRAGYARRFSLAHVSVAAIGIGSALFHMTLKYTTQLCDELPMLFGTSILLYCVLVLKRQPSQGHNMPLIIILSVVTTATSIAYIIKREPTIFFITYSILTLLMIGFGAHAIYAHGTPTARWLGGTAIGAYALGFSLWVYENNNCSTVQGIRSALGPVLGVLSQLHVWWHILAAVGGYLIVITLIYVDMLLRSEHPRIRYHSNVLPLVTSDCLPAPNTAKVGMAGNGNGSACRHCVI